jgi:predicted DNA-binding protein (MmcQ/YjbR family)
MNLEIFRKYCLSKAGTSEDIPFNETTLVFRVSNKIFAMTDIEKLPFSINLKCDPERASELREIYESIIPGYHCNKKHWNTIIMDGSLSEDLINELIDHSYQLVYDKLKSSDKQSIIESTENL